jgi:predicted ArsR family transcriptional regulator
MTLTDLPLFAPPVETRCAAHSDATARASDLDSRILASLRSAGPGTPDEIAARLGEDPLSVRPRISELGSEGKVRATGRKRPNRSGK